MPSFCVTKILFMLSVLSLIACQSDTPTIVKAKVFALSPHDYLNTNVMLSGTIQDPLPAGAGFTVADDSGRIFVSTEGVSAKIQCSTNQEILLEGSLVKNERLQKTYFVMTRLIRCGTPDASARQK